MLVNAISKFFTIGSECSQPEERFKARTKFDSIREDGEQCKEDIFRTKKTWYNSKKANAMQLSYKRIIA